MNQVQWRRFKAVSRSGITKSQCESFLPVSFDALRVLVTMDRQGRQPIDYDQANLRFSREYFDLCSSRESTREQCDRFRADFVGWLDRNALYLELNHEEYETVGGTQ